MTRDYAAERKARRAKYAADMAGMPALDEGEWEWWIGPNEEYLHSREPTREGAIQVGRDECEDGFTILEARKSELDLAAVFDLEQFCESVDDRYEDCRGEDFEGFMTDYSAEELARLETAVRQTIRQWQVSIREETGKRCMPWTFSEGRNEEHFTVGTEEDEE